MDNLDKTIDALYDEPVYKDFINRKEFIRDTGIFVTPDFFKFIYEEFKDSGLAQQEFVETYEKSNLLYICTDKAGIYRIFYIICKNLATGAGIERIVRMLWADCRIDLFMLMDGILDPVGI